ncbi:hypothetical protein D9M69_425840 [compost metagenome]
MLTGNTRMERVRNQIPATAATTTSRLGQGRVKPSAYFMPMAKSTSKNAAMSRNIQAMAVSSEALRQVRQRALGTLVGLREGLATELVVFHRHHRHVGDTDVPQHSA